MASSKASPPGGDSPPVRLAQWFAGGTGPAALALAIITVLSWAYLLTGAGTGMSPFAMTRGGFPVVPGGETAGWPLSYWLLMLAMWFVMMTAMMLPSAAPMILLHARAARHSGIEANSALFIAGYLACWLAFSMAATTGQWALETLGLSHGMAMAPTTAWLAPAVLVLAGGYQLSRYKTVCLAHCRSPVEFLSRHWRRGPFGSFRMGLAHGAYCAGCCAALMLLLFAGGVMDLWWIAGLSAVVLIEKLMPWGVPFSRITGALCLAAAAVLVLRQLS